jgi:MoaA/NifB/PqqE/SkfB family radical SAM enzyme
MNRQKHVVVWRITQDCNMRCKFCSYSCDVERKRDNADDIEVKRLMTILSEYRKSSSREMLISWIGGEPFLWKNIISFSRILLKTV